MATIPSPMYFEQGGTILDNKLKMPPHYIPYL